MYNEAMDAMTISEARATLPSLVDRVEEGEQITITRHGKAVAVLVRPDLVWPSRTHDIQVRIDAIDAMFKAARGRPLHGTMTTERAEELVAAIRAERDSW
jgi:antitoxin (DNA-binding transcriptional repressor) of toxin-antitoxin stability system